MSLQILLIAIPGFVVNYTLILWYLQSVNKLDLKTVPCLLFSAVLISSDPMLTSASIRDLGRYPFLFFFLSYTEGIFCSLLIFMLRTFVRDRFSPCVVLWGTAGCGGLANILQVLLRTAGKANGKPMLLLNKSSLPSWTKVIRAVTLHWQKGLGHHTTFLLNISCSLRQSLGRCRKTVIRTMA